MFCPGSFCVAALNCHVFGTKELACQFCFTSWVCKVFSPCTSSVAEQWLNEALLHLIWPSGESCSVPGGGNESGVVDIGPGGESCSAQGLGQSQGRARWADWPSSEDEDEANEEEEEEGSDSRLEEEEEGSGQPQKDVLPSNLEQRELRQPQGSPPVSQRRELLQPQGAPIFTQRRELPQGSKPSTHLGQGGPSRGREQHAPTEPRGAPSARPARLDGWRFVGMSSASASGSGDWQDAPGMRRELHSSSSTAVRAWEAKPPKGPSGGGSGMVEGPNKEKNKRKKEKKERKKVICLKNKFHLCLRGLQSPVSLYSSGNAL